MTYDPGERRDTPLASKLKERIRRDGPISVAEFMQACLQDAEHGYYRKQQAIGAGGDFITAPEISQIFGELIGLWCAVVWQQMGSPAKLNLVELGPGRGTLMRDAMRATRVVPRFHEVTSVYLVESNDALQSRQREALTGAAVPLTWLSDVGALRELPAAATIVLGNEFIDTLAASQFVRTPEGWQRLGVGLDAAGQLQFGPIAGRADEIEGAFDGRDAENGAIFERQDTAPLLHELEAFAAASPTAALLIDYGHTRTSVGETLQAIRDHRPEHPLCSPGEADLTVQVDFAALATVTSACGLAVDGPVTQAEFLGALGIMQRASRLMAANPAKAAAIEAGVARVMSPTGMGSRFKAFGIRGPSLPPLPGFASATIRG